MHEREDVSLTGDSMTRPRRHIRLLVSDCHEGLSLISIGLSHDVVGAAAHHTVEVGKQDGDQYMKLAQTFVM